MILMLPGDGREKVVCTTQAHALHEARTGLQQGKFVEEVQLYLRVGDNEYYLTLDSLLWAIRALKTPRQLPGDDESDDMDGQFLERMFFVEQVTAALNALYTKFLTYRLSPAWESDVLPPLKQWVDGTNEESVTI
jgi:hypothetical protein